MNVYLAQIYLNTEVKSYSKEDALAAIADQFGPGKYPAIEVLEMEVTEMDKIDGD